MSDRTSLNIPIIDVAPFITDDSAGKNRVAQAIYHACHEVGFLYIKNHGIPQAAIDKAFEQSRQFFDLPLAEKQKIAWSSGASNRGYIA